MIADAVKSALADEAHAVDHVSSGRTALTQLGLSDYQLVLLDLGLPGLDGMSVLRTLRGEGSAKNDIPVIILTARDALEFIMAGASAIEVGTANFVDPAVTGKIVDGIEEYLIRNGFDSIDAIRGII